MPLYSSHINRAIILLRLTRIHMLPPHTPSIALPLFPRLDALRALLGAATGPLVHFAGMRAYIPGPLPIRLSVVLSNLRMQHLLTKLVQPGDTVIDVGANIGYNTLFAAKCVGPTGHVTALEPAQDNLTVLYANLFANRLHNVTVLPYAGGSTRETKLFFLRGDVSAVNSIYQDNFYHPVTNTVEVLAAPLDELVSTPPALVKIDVEGGELEVLRGMTRLLAAPAVRLIIEWHPTLQQAAGHAPDALPHHLLKIGYALQLITHTKAMALRPHEISAWTEILLKKRMPVEMLAMR